MGRERSDAERAADASRAQTLREYYAGKKKANLTETQLAALARGRARLRQKQSATAAKAPAKRTASASPARKRPASPPAAAAPDSPPPATTPSASGASSSDSPSPALDANALSVFFEDDPNPAPEGQSSSGGVFSSLLGRGTPAGSSGHSQPASSAKPDKREEEVAQATAEWQEVAAQVFILVGMWIVGDELKPTTDEANKIITPLVRIIMRHYDPARQASNDVLDIAACAVASAYYVDRIHVPWVARRAEQKVRILRGSGAAPRVVPIERGTERANDRPARMAAAPAPAGDAGLRTDTVRRDPGPALSRDQGSEGYPAPGGLTAEAALEELIGGPLIPA